MVCNGVQGQMLASRLRDMSPRISAFRILPGYYFPELGFVWNSTQRTVYPNDYVHGSHFFRSGVFCWCFNSSPPSATYMRQWIGSALVQIMACRLFGAKSLSKQMLGYCQLDLWEQTSVKLWSKYKTFHFTPKQNIAQPFAQSKGHAVPIVYIDGVVQGCSSFSALAREILHSCTEPSIYRAMEVIGQQELIKTFRWWWVSLWLQTMCQLVSKVYSF